MSKQLMDVGVILTFAIMPHGVFFIWNNADFHFHSGVFLLLLFFIKMYTYPFMWSCHGM